MPRSFGHTTLRTPKGTVIVTVAGVGVARFRYVFLFFIDMAGKKKGLSMEEKRTRILELFYETQDVYQMKELEKIAPKLKGVIAQSVKEITQILVDEGLVQCEKIGTFVCYWAFPSQAVQLRNAKLEDVEKKLADNREKLDAYTEELKTAKVGKENCKERTTLLAQLAEEETKVARLQKRLVELGDYDPEVLATTKQRLEGAKEDANRWTDNIYAMKKWCKANFGVDEKTLNEQFEIPADFDYVE